MQLVFASANAHKIEEIKSILPQGFKLLTLSEIGITEEIPETGETLKENSFLKASFVNQYLKSKNIQAAVIADDSGLEVIALQGDPGVYSARYAGLPKNNAANNQKLIDALINCTQRQARFVTVITLLLNEGVHYFEGEVKGTIAYEGRGEKGFGYDPLFVPQGYRSTFAELGAQIKNKISHRSIAVQGLVNFLNNWTV